MVSRRHTDEAASRTVAANTLDASRLIERPGCRENPLRHADQTVDEIQGLSSGLTTVMSSSVSISFRREIMSPSSVVNVSRSGTVSLMVFA